MKSERLENKSNMKKQGSKYTRSTSSCKTEKEDQENCQEDIITEWYSERRKFISPLKLSYVESGTDECPILMDSFQNCKMDFDPDLKYEEKGTNGKLVVYNKVTLEGCNHSFFPLALAMHWMLHGMRCPLCKSGDDCFMSASCLPISCVKKMRRHVRKIRNEMEDDVMQQDLDLALRFSEELQEDEIGLIQSVMDDINRNQSEERRIRTGEMLPTEMILEILPIQNWRNVEFKIKLRVVFHYNDHSQEETLQALNSIGASEQWSLTSASQAGRTFQIQGFLCLNGDPDLAEDPTYGSLQIQRSQCRLMSRIIQSTSPSEVSFNVCYQEDPHMMFMICNTEIVPVKIDVAINTYLPDSITREFMMLHLSRSVNLTMTEDNQELITGFVTIKWLDDLSMNSLDTIKCVLNKRYFIARITKSKICMYLINNGLVETENQFMGA